jgi:hypothetical protein
MDRSPGVRLLVAAALCAGLASTGSAQGGWRQWDLRLRDGTRVEANPLGAPDDAHLSVSVGGFEGHDRTIPRARIDYIAAQSVVGPGRESIDGVTLPPAPTGRVCEDLIVRRDGRRTSGRVTLEKIVYSEGVVKQGGVDIDLGEIAYIKFARGGAGGSRKSCHPDGAAVAPTRDLLDRTRGQTGLTVRKGGPSAPALACGLARDDRRGPRGH